MDYKYSHITKGRFVPRRDADAWARIERIEEYLMSLSEDLDLLILKLEEITKDTEN